MNQNIEIGIIGGSGFYSLFKNAEEVRIKTPYGEPSDSIFVGEVAGKRVAFLPRHGREHQFPPHLVPYRANIYAMKQLGVKQIIAVNACGSLQVDVKPGEFVVCDQFVDRTKGREETYYRRRIRTICCCANWRLTPAKNWDIQSIKRERLS